MKRFANIALKGPLISLLSPLKKLQHESTNKISPLKNSKFYKHFPKWCNAGLVEQIDL